MNIRKNILKFKSEIPQNVKLVAVSKTKSKEEIMEAYNSGHKIFGENKVQDLTKKFNELPKDIEWHFIGHLQTNKVKYIAPFVGLLHGIDSLKLLKKINNEAIKNNRKISCLLQIHISEEETKFGLKQEEVIEILSSEEFKNLKNIKIAGLMGMATYTYNQEKIKAEFDFLAELFNKIKSKNFPNDNNFKEISMGMSSDYKIAIEVGSTIIRVGSKIFGARNY